MLNIVIFGPPGSGKGTQSDKIIEKLGFAHISTGEILRAEINAESDLGKIAKTYIDAGQLVPDALIVTILEKEYDKLSNRKGVIFDGFPRTTTQAEALKKVLNKRGTDIALMLCLEVDSDELIKRLLHRGKTSGRSDDRLETIKKRIRVYEERTAPVIQFYKEEDKYFPIQGTGDVDAIFAQIFTAIESI